MTDRESTLMDDEVYAALRAAPWPEAMEVLCAVSPVVAVGLDLVRQPSRDRYWGTLEFGAAVALYADDALRAGDLLLAAAVELGVGAPRSAYDEVVRRAVVDDGLPPWVLSTSIEMIEGLMGRYVFRSYVEPLRLLGDALRNWGDVQGDVPAHLRWDYPAWAGRFGLPGAAS